VLAALTPPDHAARAHPPLKSGEGKLLHTTPGSSPISTLEGRAIAYEFVPFVILGLVPGIQHNLCRRLSIISIEATPHCYAGYSTAALRLPLTSTSMTKMQCFFHVQFACQIGEIVHCCIGTFPFASVLPSARRRLGSRKVSGWCWRGCGMGGCRQRKTGQLIGRFLYIE